MWRKHFDRCYRFEHPAAQVFVFGAGRPSQLWAYSLHWEGGHASGVEQGFRAAKVRAIRILDQVLQLPLFTGGGARR